MAYGPALGWAARPTVLTTPKGCSNVRKIGCPQSRLIAASEVEVSSHSTFGASESRRRFSAMLCWTAPDAED